MRTLRIAAASIAFATAGTPAIAQSSATQRPQNRIALEQYLDWEDVQSPQLSPDGSHQRALVQGSDVHWSPDGKRVAYVAKGEPNGSQIFVRWMDAEGAATQVSHLTEAPSSLEWSPDGKTLAFTMNVPVKDTWRIPMPTPPKGAKWTEPPKIITKLNYRSDRIGYTDDGIRHIFVIPADGGTPRQITTGDWAASAPSFSADGKWIAFSSLREKDAESMFRKSQIYAANLETGEIKQISHRNGTNGNPEFSPDGKLIAFMSADSVDHSAWGGNEAVVDERRRIERASRVGHSGSSDLGRCVGEG